MNADSLNNSKKYVGTNLYASAKLLIVDDEERNIRLLEAILARHGFFNFVSTSDSRHLLDLYHSFEPDLVLLDLHMPHVDGFECLRALKGVQINEAYVPVVVLTADSTSQSRNEALNLGARDFLTKPIDAVETMLRVRNLLEVRFLTRDLERRVRQRTQELEEAQNEVLERLAQAAEFRDDDTGLHTQRVGEMAAQIGQSLGMDECRIDLLRRAAPLHDVGKIGIPDGILLKPGRLTPEEFERIKTHTIIGSQLLAGGRSELVRVAEIIARTHHEKWDGSGYPYGLSGQQIPLEGRIVAVCDVFDALSHERPYKAAWPLSQSIAEVRVGSGRHFDPRVVEAFLGLPVIKANM